MDTDMLDALASADPTPGGGAASAYVGAVAAALASMVGNLTVGKKAYAAVEADVAASLDRLADLRGRLVRLADADAEAFKPLSAAYRMPHATDAQARAKEEALQSALVDACNVPLDVMNACIDVVHECDFLAHNSGKLTISDAGAAVAFAKAAMYAASLNVYINVTSMADADMAQDYRDKADRLLADGSEAAEEVYQYVAGQIDALY